MHADNSADMLTSQCGDCKIVLVWSTLVTMQTFDLNIHS